MNNRAKGHEGAGGFSNACQFFDGKTGKFLGTKKNDPQPLQRGWTSAAVLGDESRLIVFGGLSGDDENPTRLNDLRVLKVN